MLTTIIIFIIILGLLVFVHEAGHFLVAKRSGMQVDEFGFGFPPRLFGFQKVDGRWRLVWGRKRPVANATVYSINWIPLGGFVKIVGENNDSEDNPKSFVNRPFWARLLTLLAGVLMNFILAWVLLSAGYATGLPVAVDSPNDLPKYAQLRDPQLGVVEVQPNSPAQQAGLQPGDIILRVDGKQFSSPVELRDYIYQHRGEAIQFEIQRFNQKQNILVRSLANPGEGQGPTGIGPAILGKLKFPWYLVPWEGLKATAYSVSAIAGGLYHIVASGQGLKDVGGVVRIAQLTGQVAGLGFVHLVQFTAFLSLNLAILNVLPIPALDGGRVLFLLIEKVRGKRNNQQLEQIVNTAGFLLLLLLMALITVRDIRNIGGLGHILSKLI